METKKIKAADLKELLDRDEVLLLDIANPEFFSAKHIQGSRNAPIFEVAFLDHVEKLTGDKMRRIVLYDDSAKPYAREDAAAKLSRAGFAKVEVFEEGLKAWEESGYPLEGREEIEAPMPAVDGRRELDIEKSLVGWTGRNAKYAHKGRISLESGHVAFKDGKLTGGEMVLDMRTIADEDLADPMWKGILESHLKSSDFFDVENYPQSKFVLTEAGLREDALPGTPNYELSGELTIKGISRTLGFEAMVSFQEDGSVNGQAHFDLDRTLWDVRYGSEKFFEKLGMHLVNDLISVELFLVAKP